MSESTTNTETKQFLDNAGLNTLWNKICSIFAPKTDIEELEDKLNAITSGLKLTASISPSVIYKNTETTVKITGTVKDNSGNYSAENITIKTGTTVLSSTENTHTLSYNDSVNISNASKSYSISAVANGLPLSASTSVTAKHPVFYGMGTSASNVKSSGTKASARSSAVSTSTYDATAADNGVRFYLLVPSDVTRPSSFTMGGAPVDMVIPTTTEKLDNIDYYVFYTNATYNSGATVKIKAN